MKKFITIIKYLFFPFIMSQATGTQNFNYILATSHTTVVKVEMGRANLPDIQSMGKKNITHIKG